MKYLLFAGESYYAKGGFNDFQGAFDNELEARNKVAEDSANNGWHGWEWWHIINSDTQEVVARSSNQAHGCYWDCYTGEDE